MTNFLFRELFKGLHLEVKGKGQRSRSKVRVKGRGQGQRSGSKVEVKGRHWGQDSVYKFTADIYSIVECKAFHTGQGIPGFYPQPSMTI